MNYEEALEAWAKKKLVEAYGFEPDRPISTDVEIDKGYEVDNSWGGQSPTVAIYISSRNDERKVWMSLSYDITYDFNTFLEELFAIAKEG
jgi:hypothetical protein